MTDATIAKLDSPASPEAITESLTSGTTMPGAHIRFSLDEATATLLKAEGNRLFASPRRATTRNLRQVFWDTETRQIGRAGVALGLQTIGQKRSQIVRDIRTIPAAGRVTLPSESPLATETLDITRVAFFPGVSADLAAALTTTTLVPVFGIDLTRTQWRCVTGATELLVSLERAVIEASAGRRTDLQLEIALVSGPVEGVFQFARHLIVNMPLQLAIRDPIQHGYILASGQDWWSDSIREPDLSGNETVKSGFLAMARAGTVALRHEIDQLSPDFAPEQIHKARVALRRLRSLLSVFQAILPTIPRLRFSTALNEMARALGEAREWDVLIESTVTPLAATIGRDDDLIYVVEQANHRRSAVTKRLKTTLPSNDYLLLCLDLGLWFDIGLWPEPPTEAEQAILDERLSDFAKKVLRQRHRKLVAAAIPDPSIGQLHMLRIQAKKLRYTADFLRCLFPAKASKTYLAHLKQIQEILGSVNDAAMAQTLITQLADPENPKGARAIGLITGWTAANAQNARDHFDQVWQEFHETKRFWR